jgi:hypothetical protein
MESTGRQRMPPDPAGGQERDRHSVRVEVTWWGMSPTHGISFI